MEHAKLPLEMPENKKDEGPVTCLGMTFENDQKRREYFTEILRQKLPELKKIEGYPIGEDEDILALSDPPYYTACPNPFINDFIEEWEQERKKHYGGGEEEYHREPFAADVTEGKTHPLYMAHNYHAKAPHQAIMRYILHYTNPGDIVLDGFAGTGMTGVAAQECGSRSAVEELGYKVLPDGNVIDESGNIVSKLGARRVIINDLSPIATFIAYNLNHPIDVQKFKKDVKDLVKQIQDECGWMYETSHVDENSLNSSKGDTTKGTIQYVIWSDVFLCSTCDKDVVYWDIAVDGDTGNMVVDMQCPSCSASLRKRDLERKWELFFDAELGMTVRHAKQVPVYIDYMYKGKRYRKKPDGEDLALLRHISEIDIPFSFPANPLPWGYNTRQPINSHGKTHVHHFFTRRNLLVLASLWSKTEGNPTLRFLLTSFLTKTASLLHNIAIKDGKINLAGAMPNVLYIPSNLAERNLIKLLQSKSKDIVRAGLDELVGGTLISTMSFGADVISEDTIDYIFIDPPFGSNLMYSELNFIWESWLRVRTNNEHEAIENEFQEKSLDGYREIMATAFGNAYKILKAGRWMTVEFSNTKAIVWNAIQSAIQEAGFVIANVSALNKGQGTFFSQTNPVSVKQDLVISAYKPSASMIEEIRATKNTEESAWTFVRNHLQKLPVFVGRKGEADLIVERTPRVLFDRMVAYHVQNGYSVPISSAEFQAGVAQRFPMRDGMAFLETQVIEYDKKRLLAKEFVQTTLFVSDENSAIEWLRQQLMQKPQTRQDLHPNFMKELQHISR